MDPGYALVADADVQRTNASLESMKADPPIAVHTTQDGEEAIRIMQRLGPPRLLIVDLALGQEGSKDGFAVIEAARGLDLGRTEIIAWAPFRALREFAAHRLAGLNVRILGGAVAPAVLRTVIVAALGRGSAREADAGV
jgi:CheY-like chemotaxis protein